MLGRVGIPGVFPVPNAERTRGFAVAVCELLHPFLWRKFPGRISRSVGKKYLAVSYEACHVQRRKTPSLLSFRVPTLKRFFDGSRL